MCGRLKLDHPSLNHLMKELGTGIAEVTFGSVNRMGLPTWPKWPIFGFAKEGTQVMLRQYRWGWGEGQVYNARIETASMDRPSMWSIAYDSQRCLVPVTSFWEHSKEFRSPQGPMMLGGLYNSNNEVAIVTQAANALIAPVHHRMPAIIAQDSWDSWLDPTISDVRDIVTPAVNLERV